MLSSSLLNNFLGYILFLDLAWIILLCADGWNSKISGAIVFSTSGVVSETLSMLSTPTVELLSLCWMWNFVPVKLGVLCKLTPFLSCLDGVSTSTVLMAGSALLVMRLSFPSGVCHQSLYFLRIALLNTEPGAVNSWCADKSGFHVAHI